MDGESGEMAYWQKKNRREAQLTALEALGSPSTDKLAHAREHEPSTYRLVLFEIS